MQNIHNFHLLILQKYYFKEKGASNYAELFIIIEGLGVSTVHGVNLRIWETPLNYIHFNLLQTPSANVTSPMAALSIFLPPEISSSGMEYGRTLSSHEAGPPLVLQLQPVRNSVHRFWQVSWYLVSNKFRRHSMLQCITVSGPCPLPRRW